MAESTSLLLLITQPPLAGLALQQALEAAMAMAAFDQRCSLVFVDDGNYALQLSIDQTQHPIAKLMAALPVYGIAPLYSLDPKHQHPHLPNSVIRLSASQTQALMRQFSHIQVF